MNLGIDCLGLSGSRFEKELKVSSSGISKLYRRVEEVTKNESEVIQIRQVNYALDNLL